MIAIAIGVVSGCGDAPPAAADDAGTTGPDIHGDPDDGGSLGPGTGPGSGSADTTGAAESDGGEDSTGGDDGTTGDGEPVVECAPTSVDFDMPPAPEYGFATEPPRMALADTFYTYDLRTRIGDCSTDLVRWSFLAGPAGAALELDASVALQPGETLDWESGGDPREHAKLAWNLDGVAPGCHELRVAWQSWLDCGALDDGEWGPEITQTWQVAVRENHWWSGDMHVHTRHSERGDEAGGAQAYYDRMVNAATDDLGRDFADRRMSSMRGRMHWLVFSEHTNNELEECGRHFATWCAEGEGAEVATGRDVVAAITEADPTTLLVIGSEISNQFQGHFGFLPKNPFPGHPVYAPGYMEGATDYEHDAGFGPGVFRERWVDEAATNDEELALITAMNGLSIVNHESAVAPWVEYDWSSLQFDGLEVWNGGNRHDQDDDSAYHGGIDLNAVTEDDLLTTEIPEEPIHRSWLGMLKTGKWPVLLVGGSDVHDSTEVVCGNFPCDPTNAELGSPMTTVWAPDFLWTNGSSGVLDGLAAARVVVHDRSNFIDLRAVHGELEYGVGDTIDLAPGDPVVLRAFGRVSDYIDGDNRVLLVLGTSGDEDDRVVDVLYSSEDATHFIEPLAGLSEMRYIRPDSSFDREIEVTIDPVKLGASGTYFVWAQFLPWHNPVYAFGNGRDHALTGAVRLRSR